jgi:hypothetical protein
VKNNATPLRKHQNAPCSPPQLVHFLNAPTASLSTRQPMHEAILINATKHSLSNAQKQLLNQNQAAPTHAPKLQRTWTMLPHTSILQDAVHKAPTPNEPNLTLPQHHFSPNDHDLEPWRLSSAWLQTLKHKPPAQRTNHCTHLLCNQQASHRSAMDKTAQLVMSSHTEHERPNNNQPPPACNTSPVPFWNAFFTFNHSLPRKRHPSTQSIATLLPTRITKLGQRRIRELRNEAFAFPELTPDSPANAITGNNEPSFDNPTLFCPEAQAKANSNNLHTAHQRMLSNLPVVKLHPNAINRTKSTLFPPRLLNHTPCADTTQALMPANTSGTGETPRPSFLECKFVPQNNC